MFPIKGSIGRESQKFYLLLAQINLKRESFCNRFQVIGFEQKFALGCKKPLLFIIYYLLLLLFYYLLFLIYLSLTTLGS